jgi:hypothetical protein
MMILGIREDRSELDVDGLLFSVPLCTAQLPEFL